MSKNGRVGKGIAVMRRSGIRLAPYDQGFSPGPGAQGGRRRAATPSRGAPPVKLSPPRFAGCGLCPLCWGSPRRRAPRATAAKAVEPPSSSGLGHRPFKAAARVRIPLGAPAGLSWQTQGPVEQLGVLATLSRWRSRVQIPSGPLGKSGGPVSPRWSGSSVGTSVRLKSGRSAVRPRP